MRLNLIQEEHTSMAGGKKKKSNCELDLELLKQLVNLVTILKKENKEIKAKTAKLTKEYKGIKARLTKVETDITFLKKEENKGIEARLTKVETELEEIQKMLSPSKQ
ncbi:hypothetical protein M378DRAFT_167839 [Amanita muscaria Koide BX008]|uniref:Uncharacterized protein n=1 Tax=Amanita muscaria (strain Koide BX008) TaxID=946122 RepID=A0A0C2T2M7_AMAMK|nr:hypothetical protein M378DRAFT_167839 [Amanita muscaria Koide BX008]